MDIESIAVSAVKDSLSWTNVLWAFINEKDKEPIWDGHIYIYNNENKSNQSYMGRIPIQVKGTIVDEFSKTATFDIETTYLQAYTKEGGTMFFLVEIKAVTQEKKIYYNNLLPFDLLKILRSAKNQKYKRLFLNAFPEDNDHKIELLYNFLRDYNKQKPMNSVGRNIEWGEVARNGYIPEITIGYIPIKKRERDVDYFFENGSYIYAKFPEGHSIPLQHIKQVESIGREINVPIFCKKTKYYDSYKYIQYKDYDEMCLGKSIKILFDVSETGSKFDIKLSGTLSERLRDCSFIVDFLNERKIQIQDTLIPFDFDIIQEDIDAWKQKQAYLKTLQHTLFNLGVREELDCDKISEEDEAKINVLIQAINNHKPVALKELNREITFGVFHVANLKIMICAYKHKDGKYLIEDYFKTKGKFTIHNINHRIIQVSKYVLIQQEQWGELSNIPFKAMLEDLKTVPQSVEHAEWINQMVLSMLSAYDIHLRAELLDAAIEVSTWLLQWQGLKDEERIIFTLNYLQCIRRKRPLLENEADKLHEIIEGTNISTDLKMGAYIILGDFAGATRHYKGLTEEQKNQYEKYPIMHLWRSAN